MYDEDSLEDHEVKRKKPPQNLRFKPKVEILYYYEPTRRKFMSLLIPVGRKADELYEERREMLEAESVTSESPTQLFCFLNPTFASEGLAPEKKPHKRLDKAYRTWQKSYFKDLRRYEKRDRKEENGYIKIMQERFHEFPRGEDFTYVFKKFRQLRELLARLRNYEVKNMFVRLISNQRYDLAQGILDYIEKDSLFLSSIEIADFDDVSSISSNLLTELINYVDFPDEPEIFERWTAYYKFFANPLVEYVRLRRVWENYYLSMINGGIVKSIIDHNLPVLKKLAARKPVKNCASNPMFKMNAIERADLYFSKRVSIKEGIQNVRFFYFCIF